MPELSQFLANATALYVVAFTRIAQPLALVALLTNKACSNLRDALVWHGWGFWICGTHTHTRYGRGRDWAFVHGMHDYITVGSEW